MVGEVLVLFHQPQKLRPRDPDRNTLCQRRRRGHAQTGLRSHRLFAEEVPHQHQPDRGLFAPGETTETFTRPFLR